MRHLILTLIAIGIAGIAAVAATTAMLNAPLRIGPAASSTPAPAQSGQTQAPVSKDVPDAPPPKGAAPQAPVPAGADPTSAKAPPAGETPAGETPEDPDKDPYEGIAPEDLPPDLQYDADASVSFPTNT
jgi:hypothetical protein